MRRRFYFMTELCVAVLYKFLLIIMSNSVTIIVYIEKGFIFILLEVFEMADEITVYDCKSNNGSVTYASDVIATIAGVAATEVKGIVGMSDGITSGFAELLGKKNLTKGIKVEIGKEEAAIDMNVVVEYGCEMHKVAGSVQENVKKAVETMTGLRVVEVNVNVQGVNVKADDSDSQKLK